MTSRVLAIKIPSGYKDAEEFLRDCELDVATPADVLALLISELNWDGSEADLNSITIGEIRRAV